ncbi:hypothetical protein DSL72_006898 [Monilinia vaccinii-corymbosi]|uniref:BTB domain-containing protein n=1 Tax=Monilinia vaccinii-corymbosi TaxID=61207 RepID=A0A8A3PLM9_9HELO|nr:hypothetical protein DSL72_006898 [Monilinia vaccinii-corymbosi]
MVTPSGTSSESWTYLDSPSSIKLLTEKLEAYKISKQLSTSGFFVSAPKRLTPNVNYSNADYISIIVGPLKTPMHIHRNILRPETRGYFKKVFGKRALKLSTSEGPCAYLPNDDWYTVGMFLRWTRHRSLTSTDKFVYKKEICTKEERLDILQKVLNLNLFAEKYHITQLQDDALALFIQLCKEEGCPLKIAHVKKCYDNTTEHAKIRQFLLRFTLWIIRDHTRVEIQKRGWNLAEIISMNFTKKDSQLETDLRALIFHHSNGAGWKAPDPRRAPPCEFHQHDKDEVCPYYKDDGFQMIEPVDAMECVEGDIANDECVNEPNDNKSKGDVKTSTQEVGESERPRWGVDLVSDILRPSTCSTE